MTTSKADGSAASVDDSDWLGYGAYADALWIRTMRALDKDKDGKQKLGDDPLVIGIFGEWGAGKSALLKLVHKRAEANLAAQIANRAGDPGYSLTVPVWFQPWKYEHEEHLHVPMVVHVLNALKDAVRQDATVVQSLVETSSKAVALLKNTAPAVAKAAKVAKAVFPVVKKIIKSISFFGVSIDLPDDLEDWLEAAADAGGSEEKGKTDASGERSGTKTTIDAAPKHVADGSYFYRIHELLGALTRPGTYADRKSLFDHAELTPNTRINFVIFIDDLDRCLPEKAVQTLELIKTVFNAESFAFVLALDEEVIERGIGHRYQAYNFAGKKPEMPITGFEYLEKIVHLPFKLPAVTASQARHFVLKLEEQIAPEGPFWFKPMKDLEASNPQRQLTIRGSAKPLDLADLDRSSDAALAPAEKVIEFDLLSLALRGFDAYVPRKLARLVELWHTTVQVAILRNQADHRKDALTASSAAQVDIRIVLTLLMVQIFHPDLYRVFRRHEETFQTLYNGFDSGGDNLSPSLSDIDLWHWAAYKHTEKDPVLATRPMHLDAALAMIAKLDDGSRYPAQQKRLPLVECIIAHRKAQRHVFDALKLFSALKQQMQALPHGFKVAQYFSLLAEYDPALTPPRVVAGLPADAGDGLSDASRRFTPVDAQQLYLSLIAADLGTQQALVEKAQLELGKFLTKEALDQLVERVKKWLAEVEEESKERRERQVQLLYGLGYLVPYIANGEGSELWGLVADAVNLAEEPNPKLRALWGDVRAKLGCDPRFETTGLCFAKKDIEDPATGFSTYSDEVPGFARIDAVDKPFWFGDGGTGSGKAVQVQGLEKEFWIARTLTTVAQYAQFVKAEDYASHFVGEGARWLADSSDKKVIDKNLRPWLDRRPNEQRNAPHDWQDQLVNPLRPVVNVCWFEAQAYVHWLDACSIQHNSKRYRASLPTELQWECAARYPDGGADGNDPKARQFPWTQGPDSAKDDKQAFAQHANIDELVGHTTTVGLYPKGRTDLGLADMAGNVWEWMGHGYVDAYDPNVELELPKATDSYSLRGGSWSFGPDGARCSSRGGTLPDDWDDSAGLRVVLSLAS